MRSTDPSRLAWRADPRRGGVRLAFVGRGVLHRPWVLSSPAGGVEPAFFERRSDTLAADLEAFAPDVVVVFDPAELPAGLAGAADALTLALLPDPLPLQRAAGDGEQDGYPWSDIDGNLRPDGDITALDGFDQSEYDRILAADPLVAQVRPELGVWRSPPLPVDDALFLPPRRPPRAPRALYLGESTERREEFLVFAKHAHDLVHYASGVTVDRLRRALEDASVGVVLHPGRSARFEPAAALHLAAGHLLVAQPLAPTRGLEPGLDHLVVREPHEVVRVLDQLAARPGAWEQVRLRGRERAEEWRASRVWPRVLADLATDLRAFGARPVAA